MTARTLVAAVVGKPAAMLAAWRLLAGATN